MRKSNNFMISPSVNETPLRGKTYSLCGVNINSDEYYARIKYLTDSFIGIFGNEKMLLQEIKKVINKKRLLNKLFRDGKEFEQVRKLVKEVKDNLSDYTTEIEDHLRTLPFSKKLKKIFTLTEQQYHLYMLFIELVNRTNVKEFKSCTYKIAFLPHCIKDRSVTCMSVKDDIDFQCKNCSKICQINLISRTLRREKIHPYIWMTADLKKLFGVLKRSNSSVGVLGISCIPELVRGIQFCQKYNLPVVGISLDANRCARWMGDFYDNTINIKELKKLIN